MIITATFQQVCVKNVFIVEVSKLAVHASPAVHRLGVKKTELGPAVTVRETPGESVCADPGAATWSGR